MTSEPRLCEIDASDFPMTVEAALAVLPEDEQEAFRACQESVIEARRSANRVEGQIWVG